jgi:hypothetical protein
MRHVAHERSKSCYPALCPESLKAHEGEPNMTTNGERGSATIYQFPTRRTATGRFDGPNFAPAIPSPNVAPTAFGSGWYHDEAIQEEQARKN